MNKICYKVVRERNNNYYSAIDSLLLRGWSIEYKINVKSKPKIGKIFVFSNFKDSEIYAINNTHLGNLRIIKGLAENIGYPKSMADSSLNIKNFWTNKKKKMKINRYISTYRIPKGTLSCDSFTPINFSSDRFASDGYW